jgi:hypothetical protein
MPVSSSLTALFLKAYSGTHPNVVTHGIESIPVSSLASGANSIRITEQSILNAIQSGVTINPSLLCEYYNGLSVVEVAGTPYVPPPPTTWVQRGADIDGEANNDYSGSGYSVSLSSNGSIVAIGAPYNAGGGSQRGHVRVYAWNGATWVQRGADIDGEANSNQSGFSVSLSTDGSIVAIGAPYNAGGGSERGHVRVYAWNGATWVQRGADIDGEANNDYSGYSVSDYSGYSVSLSSNGSIVAIGAPYAGSGSQINGHVRVYAWNGAAWVQRGADIDGEANNDQSGYSVSLSTDGSIVAIGALYNAGGGFRRGHVRVYAWNEATSTWVRRGADIDGEANSNQSGFSVSLSTDGSIVAIGAPYNAGGGSERGHVRVYAWNGATWVQRGADIDGEVNSDQSGRSVSLSTDGSIVAIGALYNAGGGTQRGHVRIYAWNGAAWVQRGADIDGEANNDQSGYSVSLSSNGSIVAIGANYNAGGGYRIGHVRVYKYQ